MVVSMATVNRAFGFGLTYGLFGAFACGGTSELERKEPPQQQADNGIDFYDCGSVTSKYEFELLSEASSFDDGSNIRNQEPVYLLQQ